MIAIVCFDLVPEALELSNLGITFAGIILGVISMIICDSRLKNNHYYKGSSLLKTGVIVGIGLALHNFPEGLAIGSGFGASFKLGISLAIAIALHDIPEGISMALPMKSGGMSKTKAILLTFLSRNNHWNRCLFWCDFGRNITKLNKPMPSICSRSNAIYSFRRANTRVEEII